MSRDTAITTRIPALYAKAPLSTRAFIWLRWRFTPYRHIASLLPRRGRVLDLGSGHGLLSLALTVGSDERDVIGVDHDQKRVQVAEAASAQRQRTSRPRFEFGPLEEKLAAIPSSSLAGIAMIDILHYFDAGGQKKILDDAARVLEPGGTLAVREVDAGGGVAAVWNRLYENIATRIGFTRSAQRKLEFRTRPGWTTLIENAGFRVRSEPCGSHLFSDVLFIGQLRP